MTDDETDDPTSEELITERVVATAERWEEYDDAEDAEEEIMEVKVTASLDGTARKFVAVVATGGPHIEVDLTNGTVSGWWGGAEHTTHLRNEPLLGALDEVYELHWTENVLAH